MGVGIHIHSSSFKVDWGCQYHLVGSVRTIMDYGIDRAWIPNNGIHRSDSTHSY